MRKRMVPVECPRGLPWRWGASEQEISADYPCTGLVDGPVVAAHRAIDVAAPVDITFRWLCELKHGSYSYRLLGGGGPRTPTPGAADLAAGQAMMIFQLVDFAYGEHLTGTTSPALLHRYGPIACTYAVRATGPARSRIVVRIEIGVPTPARRLAATALAWGDLAMMRRQLRTLRQLAEASR